MGRGKGIFGIAARIVGLIGAGAAVVGAVEKSKANKINDNASRIKNEAMTKYNDSYSYTCRVLDNLGRQKLDVIHSFDRFSNDMEILQGRPDFRNNYAKDYEMSSIAVKDFKKLSTNVQTALAAAGGAAAGALAGLAAFGATAIVASPALLCGGVVLCVKGHSLKKKAIANETQAIQLRNDVDKVVQFYGEVSKTSLYFKSSMCDVFKKYLLYLQDFENTLQRTRYWDYFSPNEKRKTENLVMLARVLYEMCKVELVVTDRFTQTEKVNYYGINTSMNKARSAFEMC